MRNLTDSQDVPRFGVIEEPNSTKGKLMKSDNLLTDSVAHTVTAIEAIANSMLIDDERSVVLMFSSEVGTERYRVFVIEHDTTIEGRPCIAEYWMADPMIDDNLSTAARNVVSAVLNRSHKAAAAHKAPPAKRTLNPCYCDSAYHPKGC